MKITELLGLKKPLVLASKSPRRRRLLKQLGFSFEVKPSRIDEDKIGFDGNPNKYAAQLASLKAGDVSSETEKDCLTLGADTIVALDGRLLHKPEDENDAFDILMTLSGRTHKVYTGIALVNGKQSAVAVETTDVTFRQLEDEEVWAYIKTGSPMDKAGAYGIQDDFGAVFVERIEGCYYNIVGLPLQLLYREIRKFVRSTK